MVNKPVPVALLKASSEFNTQLFWESHETLEPLWLCSPEPEKTFFQGLIQTAAGLVHVTKCNYKGATSLLGQGLEKLYRIKAVPFLHEWINLDEFIQQTELAQQEVERLGPEKLHLFCPGKFPNLQPK